MKLQLLLTGNELMAGHIVDSNSAMIAEQLAERGFGIARKVTIGDDFNGLVQEIRQMTADSDVLLINGGLGPTVDDLTATALAEAAGQPLTEYAAAVQHLQQWCQQKNLRLNEANRKQALLPEQASIIANPIGSAVGIALRLNDCLVLCTPGVPSELRAMLADSLLDTISQHYPNRHVPRTQRWQTFGIGESTMQQIISDKLPDWPPQIDIGFRAGLPLVEIKFTIASEQDAPLLDHWLQRLRGVIGDNIISEGTDGLAETVVRLLQQQGQQLTTAESCTGGLIASQITEVAGASQCFEAGFVSYSNSIKQLMLGVQPLSLEQHGAVSEPVVREMARGALAHSAADCAIAVSGIAGPDGGTADKPVGTVWIAWGSQEQLNSVRLQFNGPRKWFQQLVAATALDLIRRRLLGIDEEPRYFKRRKAG